MAGPCVLVRKTRIHSKSQVAEDSAPLDRPGLSSGNSSAPFLCVRNIHIFVWGHPFGFITYPQPLRSLSHRACCILKILYETSAGPICLFDGFRDETLAGPIYQMGLATQTHSTAQTHFRRCRPLAPPRHPLLPPPPARPRRFHLARRYSTPPLVCRARPPGPRPSPAVQHYEHQVSQAPPGRCDPTIRWRQLIAPAAAQHAIISRAICHITCPRGRQAKLLSLPV